VGFVWFDLRKEADWELASGPRAFAAGIRDTRYAIGLSP